MTKFCSDSFMSVRIWYKRKCWWCEFDIKELKLRLTNCYKQDWNNKSSVYGYSTFKSEIVQNNYLLDVKHISKRDRDRERETLVN